ncbi:MAG: hypothetical protein H6Q67_702 [Firmicutes bacterium]|nr:hypothetical protein [Bacillota bacterium]
MNKVWLIIIGVLFGGSIVKYELLIHVGFVPVVVAIVAVIIDLLLLGACYLILRRYPFIDVKQSMLFLGAFIALEILYDIGIINEIIRQMAFFALIAWAIFRQNGSAPRPPRQRHKWHK